MADVMMPRLGVSVAEGTLSSWLKQVGDTVEVGEPLCEVSTDKVDTEIESTVAGVLSEQLFAEGETVPVGVPLARVVVDYEQPGATPTPSSDADTGDEDEVPMSEPPEVLTPGEAPASGPSPQDGTKPDSVEAELVRMPQMGVSVTEGTLSAWLKQVGDTVAVGEALCEVSTDKVDTEIECPTAGVVLEHRYAEGDEIPVGEVIAVVGASSGTRSGSVARAKSRPAGAQPPVSESTVTDRRTGSSRLTRPGAPAELNPGPFDHGSALADMLARAAGDGRLMASPSARALAMDLAVDLNEVRGTGSGGHVTRDDVREHKAAHRASPQVLAPPLRSSHGATPVEEPPAGPPAGYEDVPHDIVPTSRIRRVTAEHMSRSRRTAAHMTTEVDVDLGLLSEVRSQLNQARVEEGRAKLSYLPFIARATCAALLDHQDLNATFQTEQLIRWNQVNLGIAVDTPRGLMVPVVHGAERLTLEPLAEAITASAARVREGKASPDDFRGGTFTISNPGSVGAVSAPAIINQPQVGILGMPAIVRRPWVVRLSDGQESIAIRPIIRLALTFDHRAVDGADATRCLVDVKQRLESWQTSDYR